MVVASARPSPFMLATYLAARAEHLAAATTILLIAAELDGRLVGGLPLQVDRWAGARLGSFVGGFDGEASDLLLAPAAPPETPTILAAAARPHADLVQLAGLGPTSAAARGGDLTLIERVAAHVLDAGPDWEAIYAAHVSAQTRKTHRKRRRRLEASGELEVHVATSPDDITRLLPAAFAVHRARWDGLRDGSLFGTDSGRAFSLAVAPQMAAHGAAYLVLLELDGAPVAFQYAFRAGTTVSLFRIGHDPAHARNAPGLIAMLTALEHACATGATRIELLGGAEDYKAGLSDRNEPLNDGVGWAHGAAGRPAALARVADLRARRLLKRSALLRRIIRGGGRRGGAPGPTSGAADEDG